MTGNCKFETLIAGSGRAGISGVNKNAIMPGKSLQMIEKFRNRMWDVYGIQKYISNEIDQKLSNEIDQKLNIIIVNSNRYSVDEKNVLLKINEKLNNIGHNSNYISWVDVPSFREQLEIMSRANSTLLAREHLC